MRIFFASDLHFDVGAGPRATVALAKWVVAEAAPDDVLLLGGDYGNDDATVARCLELFAGFPGPTLVIAGNHDVWVDPATRTSAERHAGLTATCRALGLHPLEEEPVVVDGIGFAGVMGWYDYSFRIEALDVPLEVYEGKGYPGVRGAVWNDAYRVNWGQTDPQFTDAQLQRMGAHLDQLTGAESLVLMTHHVPTEGLLRPQWLPASMSRADVVPRKWLILNTYLGSARFEALFAPHARRVEVAFCGHIHLARDVNRSGIRFVSNGSDHKQKELVIWDEGHLRRVSFSGRG